MNILIKLFNQLKEKIDIFLGWLELILKPGNDQKYKYVMERIDLREGRDKFQSVIYYKLIGCRKLLSETAFELNKKTLFTLFRPDHAQIIVSIATAETLMGYSREEMQDKYENYISFCNLKLDGKK